METGLYDKHHFPPELFRTEKLIMLPVLSLEHSMPIRISLVTNPNDFLNFDQMTDDPLEDIRVNATNDASLSKSKERLYGGYFATE